MPRSREFDPKTALEAAMQVFWANGYLETSFDDLVRETGVSRRGLYDAFGDKQGLFLAALAEYRRAVIPLLFGALDAQDVSRETLRGIFRGFVDMSQGPEGRRGCLVAKTSAVEMIRDPRIHAAIEAHWSELHSRLSRALGRMGYSEKRSTELGHYFVGVFQGLLTLAHARAGRDRIEPFIEEALKTLD